MIQDLAPGVLSLGAISGLVPMGRRLLVGIVTPQLGGELWVY